MRPAFLLPLLLLKVQRPLLKKLNLPKKKFRRLKIHKQILQKKNLNLRNGGFSALTIPTRNKINRCI